MEDLGHVFREILGLWSFPIPFSFLLPGHKFELFLPSWPPGHNTLSPQSSKTGHGLKSSKLGAQINLFSF